MNKALLNKMLVAIITLSFLFSITEINTRIETYAIESIELIQNGSFEEIGTDGFPLYWDEFALDNGVGSVELAEGEGRTGNAVRISTSDVFAISTAELDKIAVEPSTSYDLRYWVKIPEAQASVRVYVRQLNAEMGNTSVNTFYFLSEYTKEGPCDWTEINAVFTTANDCSYIYIWISARDGSAYVDDVSLTESQSVSEEGLIKNSGFESADINGVPLLWDPLPIDGGTGTYEVAEDQGFSGSAVKITAISGSFAINNAATEPIHVEPDTEYELTYMARIPDSGVELKPFIRQHTNSMGNTSENTYYAKYEHALTGICDWTQVKVEFTTAPDAGYIYIWLIVDGGEVYIDDVDLRKNTVTSGGLIQNSDFEAVTPLGNLLMWDPLTVDGGTGYIEQAPNEGRTGAAAKVTATSGSYAIENGIEYPIIVEPSTKYKLTYWVRIPDAGVTIKPFIRQHTESMGNTSENTYYAKYEYTMAGISDWQEITADFITAPDAGKIYIWLIVTGGTVYIDDVFLEPIEDVVSEGLVLNPGFEEVSFNGMPAGWAFEQSMFGSFILESEEEGYSGKSAKTSRTGEGYSILKQETAIPVRPSTTYFFSYYVKTSNAQTCRQYVTVRQFKTVGGSGDTATNAYLTPKQIYGNTEWTQVSFKFTTEEDANSINFWFIFTSQENMAFDQSEPAMLWLDNVVFEETDTIDPMDMLGFDIGTSQFPDGWMTSYTTPKPSDVSFIWEPNGYSDKAVSITKYADEGAGVLISPLLSVEPSTSYELRFFIKMENTKNASAYMFFHQYATNGDAENAFLWPSTSYWQNGDTDWKEVILPFTTSSNAVKIDIRLVLAGGTGSKAYFDEVQITKLSDEPNLDFENTIGETPENWYYGSSKDTNAEMRIDRTVSHSGNNSVYMKRNSSQRTFSLQSAVFIPVESGVFYEFSAYIKSKSSWMSSVKLHAIAYDENDVAVATLKGVDTFLSASDYLSEWKKLKTTYIIPAKAKKVQFSFLILPGTAEVWLDDITLKRVNDISTNIVYWDDFHSITSDGDIGEWEVLNNDDAAEFTNDAETAKLVVSRGEVYISRKLNMLKTDYTYRVTGRYKTTAETLFETKLEYIDYMGRKMDSLSVVETFSASTSWTNFEFLTKTPSSTTANLLLGTSSPGTVWVDDIEIFQVAMPESGSSWKGQWVWYPENASLNAIRENRYFRYTFDIEDSIDKAFIQISADDKFVFYINGTEVDRETSDLADTWASPHIIDITEYLKEGKNVFAISAYNVVSSAGIIFDARIMLENGLTVIAASGPNVLTTYEEEYGWTEEGFDDSNWSKVMTIGYPPILPWANLYFDNSLFLDCAFEVIQFETTERYVECGTSATINARLKLETPVVNEPVFKVYLWKRNTMTRVTTSILKLEDGGKAVNWPVGEEFDVVFTMHVPEYIESGNYTLQMDENVAKILNEDAYDNKFAYIRAVKTETDEERLTSKVKVHNGKPTLFINGKPKSYMAFLMPVSQTHFDEQAAVNVGKTGIDLYMTFNGTLSGTVETSLWKRDGTPNYDLLDTLILQALSVNPDAHLMLTFIITAPDWWLQKNPNEAVLNSNGESAGMSYSSELFKEEAGEIVRLLTAHAMNASYANKLYGIRLTGGQTAEWLNFSMGLNKAIDFSPCAQTGFRKWLISRYDNDVTKLKAAWNDDSVDFDSATVPTYEERVESEYISILDPIVQRNVIDFHIYMSDAVGDSFLHFAKIVKEEVENRIIVGGYYGYLWNFYSYEANGNAHMSVDRILESEYVDFISAPQNYNERDLGHAPAFMAMVDSVHANGKLFVVEQDNRTVLAQSIEDAELDSGVGYTYTMEDSLNQLKRDMSNNMIKGAGMWFYDMNGGWFDDDQIYGIMESMKTELDFSLNVNKKSTSDVAVFVDEQTYAYTAYQFGATYQIFHYMYLMQRQNLGTMGAPFDMYTISDLEKDLVPDYKINIILSPFLLTDSEKEAIDRSLKRDNKIIVWIYLPGISDGSTNDISFVSELTGIELGMDVKAFSPNVRIAESDHPLVKGISSLTFGSDAVDEVGPAPYVADSEADILGYLADSNKVGLASKDLGDWTSVYSAAFNLPNKMLANLINMVDGHLYSDNRDDIILANNHYVSIHSLYGGEKTIKLPKTHSVYDVFAHEMIDLDTDIINLTLTGGETKLYRLMTAGTYSVSISASAGGTVYPEGLVEVPADSNLDLNINSNDGYKIKSVLLNGEEIYLDGDILHIDQIGSNVTIKVEFTKTEIVDEDGYNTDDDNAANPQTLDNIMNYGAIAALMCLVIIATMAYDKKRKETKKHAGK